MSLVRDAITAMKDVVLMNDKVERCAKDLEAQAKHLYEHELRLVKIETIVDLAVSRSKLITKD